MGLREHVEEAAEYLRGRMPFVPEAMVILGSGLGGLVDGLACAMRIPMREIPHWPLPSVPGHRGEAVWCEVGSTRTLVLAGRAHLYEGFSPQQVALPVHTGASLGAKVLIVTNAAGGINPKFHPGDLMLVQDHINLMFRSPLVGTQ
ncbi:MAG: purine-nucleoside phosphorylase, partial [candidate division KSB1 bacterium]|nr:purine-nucleoside phosphorylase [candidate division KSB1 bacterium]